MDERDVNDYGTGQDSLLMTTMERAGKVSEEKTSPGPANVGYAEQVGR